MSGCQGLGEQDEECVFNVDAVSFWGDGNVLEPGRWWHNILNYSTSLNCTL